MPDLSAPDAQIARLLIERGLGVIYLCAFLVALRQFPALCGERGLDPAPQFLRLVPFIQAPSVFHLRYSDRLLLASAALGALVSALVVVGLVAAAPLPVTMLTWFLLWVLYQSIVNIGGAFYSFGWETLLLEAGFLAIFLGNAATAPQWPIMLLFRWLAFRVEFGAGLIKLRGDSCWRDLTCMDYHHETQPMPNPLSWFAHRAPRAFHRVEVLGNFAAQLVLPLGLFLPQPFASVSAALMIGGMLYLVATGNYAWLNWVTIVILAAGLSDPVLLAVLPVLPVPGTVEPAPVWFGAIVLGVTALVLVLSYWPVRNLLSPGQRMNASFDPFRLVNTYGAFGSVTRSRYEVVVEGTAASEVTPDTIWREYEFKGKPADPRRLPPQVAPYHLRLDWLMWFIPISPAYAEGWFGAFLVRLLEADRPTLRLLRRSPFGEARPTFVRARFFLYRFTTWRERRESGAWWVREPVTELVPPVGLSEGAEP